MAIEVLITGGTFDKEYDERTGDLYFNGTHLHEILKSGKTDLHLKIRTIMMIDSKDMNDTSRAIILEYCHKCRGNKIVITHGTDTMVETAQYLAKAIKNKTIVLTGAMKPYKFNSSDGIFNIGTALSFVQTLPPGVYIAMHGKYFNWDNVRKNRAIGRFETLRKDR